MPESFVGKSVLDIGCNSGSFSFEAERLGADRVLAADIHPPEARGFKLLSEIKQSRVEYVQASLYELTPEKFGTFDFVFFLGLLYHLEHPLLGLQKASAMCNESVIVETHVMESPESLENVPIARFYPGDELNNDRSNWWGPNVACLREMIKVAGFRVQDIGYVPDGNSTGRAAFWGHK
jgi:tRNA (mo5U34)-methyltransferase